MFYWRLCRIRILTFRFPIFRNRGFQISGQAVSPHRYIQMNASKNGFVRQCCQQTIDQLKAEKDAIEAEVIG